MNQSLGACTIVLVLCAHAGPYEYSDKVKLLGVLSKLNVERQEPNHLTHPLPDISVGYPSSIPHMGHDSTGSSCCT